MEQYSFFPYSWHIDEDEEEVTVIRIYGLDNKNENVCVRIDNFTPFVYLELPEHIPWTASKAQLVTNKLDTMLGDSKPIIKRLMYKKRLYYANLDSKKRQKTFPYIFLSFSHQSDIRNMSYKIRAPLNIVGVGHIKVKMHEQDASPILQLTSYRNVSTAGWIDFIGKRIEKDEQITLCDKEYKVKWKNIKPNQTPTVANPLIMGFDIEVNSTNPSAMPKADKPGDKVFQISCVLFRHGERENNMNKFLLTLGEPDPKIVGEDVEILMFETEHDLLIGYTEFIQEYNPNIIVGYNILNFDIPYMIDRAKFNYCIFEYDQQGFNKYGHAKEKTIKWSSSAYGNQTFQFLDAEGRLYIDLLPLVKRDYKMDNYKLKTISTFFLGSTKDPLSVKGIFKCYRIGIKNVDGVYSQQAKKAMAICGKYCVQDSVLVIKLFNKLQTWIGLCEMAKTCQVPIFYLYTQGQQIKVYSQLYRFCMYNNFVVEKDGYIAKDNEHYVGAHVFEPIAGVYDKVLPFDFCLSGDTLISMSNGTSKRIIDITDDELVLGYNDHTKSLHNYSTINGLQCKGKKKTVKIYLEDGSTIISTPDHRFMSETGEWIKAEELNNKNMLCGVEYTENKKYQDEVIWEMVINDYIFDMKSNRENTLAFSRMLGYILSDGSIYISGDRKRVEVCFGTLLDAKNFKLDMIRFHKKDVSIRKRSSNIKGTTYNISLTSKLSLMVHNTKGILIGKRSTQPMTLPAFILDENCPKAVIREFLGGLYGGDGTAPYLTSTENFGGISFKWTVIEKYIEDMKNTFINIDKLHQKLGVITSIQKPHIVKYGKNDKMIPTDIKENPRWNIQLSLKTEDTHIFLTNIGFRYCINKSCKLYAVSSYQRMINKVREQHNKVVHRTNELINTTIKNVFSRNKGDPTFETCLEQSRKEFLNIEPSINIYSLSSVKDIGYIRHEEKRHSNRSRKISLSYKKYFPTFKKYIENIGVQHWFSVGMNKSYAVNQDDEKVPCCIKKVIDVREYEEIDVFDIEVTRSHSFIANGVIAHNCSLYPTTIIAYNIDYSTLVKDTNIPDSDCHVIEWQDCIGCEHDKTVRKTKPKHIMCEKRYFRFLKEPKGVMPTVLQNLLDARANTRKQIKIIDKILENNEIDEKEHNMVVELIPEFLKILKNNDKIPKERLNELKTLTGVLDKRQLAYKVSANSMYGAMGVTRGYLPFMPGAMCTTAMGRKNINIAASTIENKFGGKLIYGDTDSCLPDTPVLISNNGNIEYMTMEELSDGNWKDTITGKQISKPKKGLLVWSDTGFTEIKEVIRHAITKPLIRVTTHVGSVECTLDHSLLWENGEAAKASDVKIGSKLRISELPLPNDTPKIPLYKNKLTEEIIEKYVIPKCFLIDNDMSAELAFVWGMFYAEGSCGIYNRKKNGLCSSWAITGQDNKLLTRCADILNKHEKKIQFKILDTMKSSNANKLVPYCIKKGEYGVIKEFVQRYRELFYDCRRSKRVPSIILNAPFDFRQAFFMGYYAGDGSKKDPSISLSNKGAIGSAGLFYIMKSIGYQVSINTRADKPTIYKLTGSTPAKKMRYTPNVVKKIHPTAIYNKNTPLIRSKEDDDVKREEKPEYIYDIETENHHFSAGVGELVVHNSNYVCFPHLNTSEENWDHAVYVSKEVSKLFPAPIQLEFEQQIYWRFFILTKKRYMYKMCKRNGIVDEKIGKKGVLLARRDNSMFIRDCYETLIMKVFNKESREDILYYIIETIKKLCSHYYSYKDFIVTKSVSNHGGGQVVPFINEKGKKKGKMGDYTVTLLSIDEKERNRQLKLKDCTNAKDYYIRCLPAVVQLAERMRQRGQRVDPGTRLEYVISSQGGHKAKQYMKVEDAIYFGQHSSVLKIDYMYYLKLMTNPFDDVLNVMYNRDDESKYKFKKDYVLNQYKYILNIRTKVLEELLDLFKPKIIFIV